VRTPKELAMRSLSDSDPLLSASDWREEESREEDGVVEPVVFRVVLVLFAWRLGPSSEVKASSERSMFLNSSLASRAARGRLGERFLPSRGLEGPEGGCGPGVAGWREVALGRFRLPPECPS
jgi:hypothetical protein